MLSSLSSALSLAPARKPLHSLLCILLLVAPAACSGGGSGGNGGGGGGGGGGPTAPTTPFTLPGTYVGDLSWRLPGMPESHCLARWLSDEVGGLGGHGFHAQVTLQQNGSAVSGTVQGMDLATTCQLQGTLGDNGELRWSQTTCSQPCARFAHPTLSCPELRICVVEREVEARFSTATGRISGSQRVVWEATEMASGTLHGRVTFEGDVELRR
jgi:hypothetical protein